MNQPVPQQQSRTDAASTPPADRSVPEFPQHASRPVPGAHTPIEREIERSERASAALAATRALARASFTDSQLAAEDANEDGDGDAAASAWVRTEYAALDHSVRELQDDVPHEGAPHNLVGGAFHPGMAFQSVRTFPGASVAQTPMRTRGGAQARFLQESRHAPRPERGAAAASRTEHSLSSGAGLYDKPAVLPSRGTPGAAPVTAPTPAGRAPASVRGPAGGSLRFALAVGLGAVAVLAGGVFVSKAGWLAHDRAGVASGIAGKAQAARAMAAAQEEIARVPPAAGVAPERSQQEVNDALAAAARAAAVPVASVQAAGPARVARPLAILTPPPTAKSHAAPRAASGKAGVAAAIANAQARADSFLAPVNAAPAAAAAAPEVKPAQ